MDTLTILSLIVIFVMGTFAICVTAFYPSYLEKKMNEELKKKIFDN